jgi:putative PIN family toxin of toxin-antitoxin system
LIKAVLDTNIFISSIFWLGPPNKIILKVIDKKVSIFISLDILNEIEKILRIKFGLDDELTRRNINLILSYCHLIPVKKNIDVIKEDPADNKILACALEADANYIVSGDMHLLKLKGFNGIEIVSAKEFLDFI